MTEQGSVIYRVEDQICTITFKHPKSNSLPGYLLRDLADGIDKAAR